MKSYEATLYDSRGPRTTFEISGELLERETLTLVDLGDDFATGTVQHMEAGVICRLGGAWTSEERIVNVQGSCDDSSTRLITLDFVDVDVSAGGAPRISVEDDANWIHPQFEWRWRKCSLENCFQPPQ